MKLLTLSLLLLASLPLQAAPTWQDIVADDRICPHEVALTKETVVELQGDAGPIGTFTLPAGAVVTVDKTPADHIIGYYPGRISLPGINRKDFSEVQAPAGGQPGKAVLKSPLNVQIAGPDGGPGPLLKLVPNAVIAASAVTESSVTLALPILRGPIPWQNTDILERAKPLQEELKEELAQRAATAEQAALVQRLDEAANAAVGGDDPTKAVPVETISVKVSTTKTHQPIEGFGTCLLTWNPQIQAFYKTKEFEKAYIDDFGFTVLRCELAPQSLPDPVNKPEDIKASKLQMDNITSTFIDFAKRLKKKSPDAKIIGTVWSPPAWMKATNSIGDPPLKAGSRSGNIPYNAYTGTENYVKKEFYPHFVQWLVEIAKLYEKEGAGLYAISPGNEVLFTQWFQSCVWTAEDYSEICAMLDDALKKNGLGHIKIFGPETMTGHTFSNRPFLNVLLNSKGGKAIDVFATHGYVDGIKGDSKAESSYEFWNLIEKEKKPYWVTEGGTGEHDWPRPLSGTAAFFHNNLVFGNASMVVPWQIVETKADEHAQMLLTGYTKKSHATMHYTRFIRPGATRVQAEPAQGAVMASAFTHPRHGTTIVIVNPRAAALTIKLSVSGKAPSSLKMWRTSATENVKEVPAPTRNGSDWEFVLPGNSIVTLQGT
jgi:O-glycosyl hydrolase